MTKIHLQTLRDAVGGAIPARSKLIAEATRIRVDGPTVTFPLPVSVIVTGAVDQTIELTAPDATWAWTFRLAVMGPTGRMLAPELIGTYTFSGADIDWGDMTQVSPQSYDPGVSPPDAWWITVQNLQDQIDALGVAVQSVNGKTGVVVLSAADVGAAPTVHTHTVAQVTGLQGLLDGKQPAGSYATTQNLSDGLATKANLVHTHTTAQVVGLDDTLAGLATTAALTAGLATKANTVHTHTASQISDSTAVGRSLVTAADAAAARAAIGVGTGTGTVTSVNGDPGPAVVLDAASVGARPSNWVPVPADLGITNTSQVVARDTGAGFTPITYSKAAVNDALVQRSSGGMVSFQDGTNPSNGATKGQLDTAIATRAALVHTHAATDVTSGVFAPERVALTGNQTVLVRNTSGALTGIAYSTVPSVVSSFVQRDAAGIARGATAVGADDLVPKNQMDTQLATKAALVHTHSATDITSGILPYQRLNLLTMQTALIRNAAGDLQGLPYTTSLTANALVQRNASGGVDTAVATLQNHAVQFAQFNTAMALKADASAISNIDNTSDANKPISTATSAALALKADKTQLTYMLVGQTVTAIGNADPALPEGAVVVVG